MSEEFWEWLEDELIEANQWDTLRAIGKEATYELALCKEFPGGGSYEPSLGIVTPDDDLIASWYVSIPTTGASYEYNDEKGRYEWVEGPLLPGNYKVEPAVRVELTTGGLRNRCSTTELRWHSIVNFPVLTLP
jgi:hypothetical protein